MSDPTCGYHCANPATWHLTTDCGCINQHVCEQHARNHVVSKSVLEEIA